MFAACDRGISILSVPLSLSVVLILSIFPFLLLTAGLVASCCSAVEKTQKRGLADGTNLVLGGDRLDRTKGFFSTCLIPDPVALTRPKMKAPPFYLPLLFFCLALASFKNAAQPSAKKHFISDPIISRA